MTADRAQTLAFLDHLLKVGCFHLTDMKEILAKREELIKLLEKEGAMEISNDITPNVSFTQEQTPIDTPAPGTDKGPAVATEKKEDAKPKDLDF